MITCNFALHKKDQYRSGKNLTLVVLVDALLKENSKKITNGVERFCLKRTVQYIGLQRVNDGDT